MFFSTFVLSVKNKGNLFRRKHEFNNRELEHSKKHSLDVLKNLENEDFANGFDFSNLGMDNSKFWQKFNEHFKNQNQQMKKHFAKMQKKLKQKIKKQTKKAKQEANQIQQKAKQNEKQILKAALIAKNAAKLNQTTEEPETKTVIYTDEAGNKVIEKRSHHSKKFHTKHGFGVTSSTSTSINSTSPGGSAVSINSGGDGVVIVNGRVIPMKGDGALLRKNVLPMREFERFFGKMQGPMDESNVLMNPFG